MKSTRIAVYGMTCTNCSSAIERALSARAGVSEVKCSHELDQCAITFDEALISVAKIEEAIEDCGFDLTPPRPATSEGESLLDASSSTWRPTSGSEKSSVTVAVTPDSGEAASLSTTMIAIQGMTCGSCTAAIERQVNPDKVNGLAKFSVSLIAERASALHDESILPAHAIVEMIEDCGFDAQVVSTEPSVAAAAVTSAKSGGIETIMLKVYGMHCGSCVNKVEQKLLSLDGVQDAVVNLSLEEVRIVLDSAIVGTRDCVEAIQSLGFTALLADSQDNATQLESLARLKEIAMWRHAFWTSLCWMLPIFVIHMMISHTQWGGDLYHARFVLHGLALGDFVCMLLTIPIQFGIGRRFYLSAYRSVRHGAATMDVLVCVGTTAAFVFSILSMAVAIFSPTHPTASTFFDTSAMLITFVTLGRYLENKAKASTSAALSRLMCLAPSTATIYLHPDSPEKIEEKIIPTELIQVNDVVLLKPGAKVPADGVVVAGDSYLDESMITGEARPARKQVGDMVVAGTVNGRGRLDVRVTRTGRDTQLAQIVRLVQEAQTSRAPIQRFSDRVAGYFVPAILSLGLITFLAWIVLSWLMPHPPMMFVRASELAGGRFMACLKLCISVIVVACPCALGLATPTAVMVGTGMAASRGILIKGGAILEIATRVTHCVFDKTGTLTRGRMDVVRSQQAAQWTQGRNRKLWWTLIAAAEQHSEHPTGRATVEQAKAELEIDVADTVAAETMEFEAIPGRGVRAKLRPAATAIGSASTVYDVLVGNARLMTENGIATLDTITLSALAADEAQGHTCVHVAIDRSPAGYLALTDSLRPDARRTVAAMQRLGVRPLLVTGDRRSVALRVAHAVGIDERDVYADRSPADKQAIVRRLQTEPVPIGARKGAGLDGRAVVMVVGDGINDSPALASADVGCAVASGAEVAVEAADVVLMRSDRLLDAAVALLCCRHIFSRIRWNLVWAAGYNVLAVPVAMGVFLPWNIHMHPAVAAALMAMSSVSVVCSSLLLRYWRPPAWLADDDTSSDYGAEELEAGDRAVGLMQPVRQDSFDLDAEDPSSERRSTLSGLRSSGGDAAVGGAVRVSTPNLWRDIRSAAGSALTTLSWSKRGDGGANAGGDGNELRPMPIASV